MRSWLALGLLALGGCAAAGNVLQKAPTVLGSKRSGLSGREHVFTVDWWTRVAEIDALPFKPVEPGAVDVDPATGNVYAATSDGKVHAVDRHGKELWLYDAGGAFSSGPTFAEERVYVATSEGKLVALHAYTGEKVWQYDAGEELITRPTVADGHVFAMSAADTLFAVDARTGAWKWQYRRDVPAEFTIRGAARPLVSSGRVFAGFADGYAVALEVGDGSVKWARPLASNAQYLDVDADPVGDDEGRVYFASFASGVFCLDGETGTTVWERDQHGITALLLDAGTGRLIAGGTSRLLSIRVDNGAPAWTLNLGEAYVSGLAIVRGLVLVSTGEGPLLFVDAANGDARRAFDPGRGVTASGTVIGPASALVMSNRGFLYALSIDARGSRL